MSESAVVDIASFVWDRDDFENNKYAYWELVSNKICLLDELKKSKLGLLLRSQLRDNIWAEFPYNNSPNTTKDTYNRINFFLTTTKLEEYSDNILKDLVSFPNQIKLYFSESIKKEKSYMLSEIFVKDSIYFYFTFKKNWKESSKLVLKNNTAKKDIKAVVIKDEQDILSFFKSYNPTFDHNPKHDRIKRGEYRSSLSCYDGVDDTIPKKLLNTAIEHQGVYYNFDINNNVWVVFRNHLNNLYHGYDEVNKQKIPNRVRKKLGRQ